MNAQLKGAAIRPVFTLHAWSATSVNRMLRPNHLPVSTVASPHFALPRQPRYCLFRDNCKNPLSSQWRQCVRHRHNCPGSGVCRILSHSFFIRPCRITMQHMALLFARCIRYRLVQSLLLQCKLLDHLSKQVICPRFPSGRKTSIVLCLNLVGRVISASISSQFNYSCVRMNRGFALGRIEEYLIIIFPAAGAWLVSLSGMLLSYCCSSTTTVGLFCVYLV